VRQCGWLVCLWLMMPLVSSGADPAPPDRFAPDEELLGKEGVPVDSEGLLAYLRSRTLSKKKLSHLEEVAQQLGSDSFQVREHASAELIRVGQPAVPFLRPLLTSPDLEVRRRAQHCVDTIVRGSASVLTSAVIRLLVPRHPPDAVEVLLAFAPFADDEQVEEELRLALTALGQSKGQALPAVVAALHDPLAARRALACHVVGQSSDRDQRKKVIPLLDDPEPSVRFWAARSLLFSQDRRAVPVLIDLLAGGPEALAWRAEELLIRLAGSASPEVVSGEAPDKERRQQWKQAWARWWSEKGATVDLASLKRGPAFLGLVLVAEMHGAKIWECNRKGKVLWELKGLQQPRVAQVLPGNRVLVGEVTANRVTERDRSTGKVLWSYEVSDPAYVERLPNGNTFIGNHARAFEITRAGKEVFSYTPEKGFGIIHSMYRKADGHLVCLSMSGILREIDRSGKEVRSLNLGNRGGRNWCGVQPLPGGRYLVVDFRQGEVLEINARGDVLWKFQEKGASYALRLPTGTTLICGFSTCRVLEVNREGKILWSKSVPTKPWRIQVR
jgi:hypothetical protein